MDIGKAAVAGVSAVVEARDRKKYMKKEIELKEENLKMEREKHQSRMEKEAIEKEIIDIEYKMKKLELKEKEEQDERKKKENKQKFDVLSALLYKKRQELPEPDGWTKYEADDGRSYYVHDLSGHTQWDKPTPLPNGWREMFMEGNETPYYIHTQSQRTQWEKPSFIPNGWTEVFIEGSSSPYYLHTHSGLTQWEKPTSTVRSNLCEDTDNEEYKNDCKVLKDFTTVYKEPKENANTFNIRTFKFTTEIEDHENQIRVKSVGNKNSKIAKTLLLVGATGTGKTSILSTLVNNFYRVKFEDDFRLKIVEQECQDKAQSASQTEWITIFRFYNTLDNYNITVIDTPGVNDTRGIQYDKLMFQRLEKAFVDKRFDVDFINCIGMTTVASATRLTPSQIYTYDQCMKLFGKDVKENIHVLATFSDKAKPKIEAALLAGGVEYVKIHKLNNSIIYLPNHDDDDEDSIEENKLYWRRMQKTCFQFLNEFESIAPKKLAQTVATLTSRQELYDNIEAVDSDILENIIHPNKKSCDEKALNCNTCKMTCHYPCYGPGSCQTCDNLTIDNACFICKCKHKDHVTENYSFSSQLLGMSEQGMKNLIENFERVNELVQTLKEVALKPHTMAKSKYIDKLIEELSEIDTDIGRENISRLQAEKQQEEAMNAITDHNLMDKLKRMSGLVKNGIKEINKTRNETQAKGECQMQSGIKERKKSKKEIKSVREYETKKGNTMGCMIL